MTIEIRDDKPGEHTQPEKTEKETTVIPPAVQAQIDALTATVQGLKKRHDPLDEVDHRAGSPFCARIRAAQPPAKYKAPTLAVYTGKEDPMRHVGKLEDQMELIGVGGDYR